METLFLFLGIVVIFCLITLAGYTDDIVGLSNKSKKPEEIERSTLATMGCSALFVYGWYLVGLFTSQWFICAVWLTIGLIESTIKKLFGIKFHPVSLYAGLVIDVVFVLFIIINGYWLHIDVYHWFIGLF